MPGQFLSHQEVLRRLTGDPNFGDGWGPSSDSHFASYGYFEDPELIDTFNDDDQVNLLEEVARYRAKGEFEMALKLLLLLHTQCMQAAPGILEAEHVKVLKALGEIYT